ncbi:hypothetical protein N431DRAFT_458614 [Stipitochalara longipes BDJ]|nr:hypothetical protein N431DRAFT_458614 [Stipitochalara longipes BDJ]
MSFMRVNFIAAGAEQSESKAPKRQLSWFANQLKITKHTRSKKHTKGLLDLPSDVIREIFDHLHPIHSACLGLTCKALYPIHWSLHPKLVLHSSATVPHAVWANFLAPFSNRRKEVLAGLLIEWASPLIWSIEEDERDRRINKGFLFMTKERHHQLRAQGKKRFRFRI